GEISQPNYFLFGCSLVLRRPVGCKLQGLSSRWVNPQNGSHGPFELRPTEPKTESTRDQREVPSGSTGFLSISQQMIPFRPHDELLFIASLERNQPQLRRSDLDWRKHVSSFGHQS